MRVGYYWPKLFSDVNAKVRACNSCQLFAGKQKLPALPLVLVKMEALFQQWGLDFIGEISPHSSAQQMVPSRYRLFHQVGGSYSD
jgi:hypothetical protein